MPPEIKSQKLKRYVKEFGNNIFSTNGIIIRCDVCDAKVNADKRFQLTQHVQTDKHQFNLKKKNDSNYKKQLILSDEMFKESSLNDEFNKELCEALV